MAEVTVYHNPACGTSRRVLALLKERGLSPRVIEYLKTPPSREEVGALAARAGVPVRELVRDKAAPFAELGLGEPGVSDEALLDAIAEHPLLLNRPIVVTDAGVRLCRPAETVLELLPPLGALGTKEIAEAVPTEGAAKD
jgi:arsenate reductase